MNDSYKHTDELQKSIEEKFYQSFLPVIISGDERATVEQDARIGSYRMWRGYSGKVVLFLPPPAKVKDNPHEKPDRLGRVIKRLAECYRLDLDGKLSLAREVMQFILDATESVAVAFSGGRDSLVALHIALQYKPDVKVLFVNTSIEFPETLRYVRWLAEEWQLNFYEVKPRVNFWRLAEEQGLPVAGRGNTTFMRKLAQKSCVKLSNSCCRRMKETPARQFYKEHRIEGVITGLRVSESLMRKLNFADYGAVRYSSTYNTLVAWPLYAWKDEDIQEYITRHQLPVNPLYEMGYKRVGCWACLQDMFYKDSRLFTLQQQHPKMYQSLRKKFGDKMMRLLSAWAGLEEWEFQEEHLDGLYRPCSFEMLDEYRKQKKSREE
ncbi:MAG: phosphoadenosine phosphosulfate reductase family protein [Candidatus Methanomethylicaceae archaeon]